MRERPLHFYGLSFANQATPLPSNGSVGSLILTSNGSQSEIISDVNVAFDLDHSCTKDLSATLTSPAGTSVVLFDLGFYPVCGSNMKDTLLDDDANQSISNGTNPYTGSYRPQALLSNFNGENLAGTWTLSFVDQNMGDSGELQYANLEIQFLK